MEGAYLRLARMWSRILSLRLDPIRWCSETYMNPTCVSGSALQNACQALPEIRKFSPTLMAQIRCFCSTRVTCSSCASNIPCKGKS